MKKQHPPFDVAVVGGGSAGTMAYLRCILNNDRTVFFLGDAATKKRGRGTWVSEVDNIPGFHGMRKPVTTTTLSTLKWLKEHEHLKDNGLVLRAAATKLECKDQGFVLSYFDHGVESTIECRYLIIATGVMDVQPKINGSIETIFPYANRNEVIYCIRCDGHRLLGHTLSILGHRDSAVHIGAILYERYKNPAVYILTNGEEPQFSDESKKLIAAYGFQVETAVITGVVGDAKVDGAGLEGYQLGDRFIASSRSVVALGVMAYNDLLKSLGAALTQEGRAEVSQKCESSVSNVFVVGDLAAGRKMQIYTAWDEAVDAADEINFRIRSQKRAAALGLHG